MTKMEKLTTSTTLLVALLVVLSAGAATATAGEAFDGVIEPYGAVHRALVADDLDALRAPAERLAAEIATLRRGLDAGTAGFPAGHRQTVRDLLPELEAAAAALGDAGDLAAARDAFYALSKPLVRWRQALGEGPAVVYCSMKKRSWLQPSEQEIGNPYYGQEMATCGEIVSS